MANHNEVRSGIKAETHRDLATMSTQEFAEQGAKAIADADQGIQTAITGGDGSVRTIVGLNGVRYLPDPDPDPLDEIMRVILSGEDQ